MTQQIHPFNVTKEELLKQHPPVHVETFFHYLVKLSNDTKNQWINTIPADKLIAVFNKVANTKLHIDGESVRMEFRSNDIFISYDYHAYKNKIIQVYPETVFDIGLVHVGDEFNFTKNNGSIIYTHKIADPFRHNKEIIGSYCIIKNKRGESLETINQEDIKAFRSLAKQKNVWDTWYSEMVLKSVIKRACKRSFKDIIEDIDEIDNENYDLSKTKQSAKEQADSKETTKRIKSLQKFASIVELENAKKYYNTPELEEAFNLRYQQLTQTS